jgi:F420-dependent oxidoreductase-like protein
MVRFGVVAWKNYEFHPFDFSIIKQLAVKSEQLGFDSFWLADHLEGPPPTKQFYECYTTLSAIAMATEKIRLGSLVTCISYRQPSLLAKMTATLDVISGGRFDLALGAGWDVDEYNAYGFPFPSAGERVEQLAENIEILTKMWTEKSATFKGEHFEIKNAVLEPKPVQRPHPPLWIGGRGKRMLALTAKYADGWNIDSIQVPLISEKLGDLKKSCANIGRNVNEIKKSAAGTIVIRRTDDEVREVIDRYCREFQLKRDDYLAGKIVGTPGEVTEKIEKIASQDMDLILLHFVDWPTIKPLELFAKEVMPKFS